MDRAQDIVDEGRRSFLKIGAAAGGALLVGFHLPGCERRLGASEPNGAEGFAPNAWIRIAPDGTVTLFVASSEMGQGVYTAIPMILAEELECDWRQVRIEFAPVHPDYNNPRFGQQLTGGSTAVRAYFTPLREAAASARELLIAAAAETWHVPREECRAENGEVMHEKSGRRLGFGALAARAATLPTPGQVFLKDPEDFRLLGKPMPRRDTPAKVNGSAVFGQDVRLPGMLMATVARCPVFGGRLKSFDASAAKAVPGVREVLAVSAGVAVVAEHSWAALEGRRRLRIEWDEGPNAALDSEAIRRRFIEAARRPGAIARAEGDVAKALREAGPRRLKASYELPFLAHACMEPMNATARVTAEGVEVWAPTQAQTRTQKVAAEIAHVAPEKVKVHTTFLGGGFGRRSETDFVADAVELAKRIGRPVQVIWTREDDIRHDFYRPATYNELEAALDEKGWPVAWRHHIVAPSIFARVFPRAVADGLDRTAVEGAADLPYAIPHLHVSYVMENTPVPVGFWRSVGFSQNTFVTECFLDELAAAGHQDPYRLRRALLAQNRHKRHLAVLELAAEKAGWGRPLPRGRQRGIAVAESFGSFVAQVAEVSVRDGAVRVHRVVCAVDCGLVVNPDTVVAQMESGIVYGLTAALKGEITIAQGRVVQSNFHDYPLLRFDEMPAIEVHLIESDEPPGGVGEPGTPPIAPAVANAVFAATGKPVRRLPIRL
jgi:isoquinoline 1-oxidoreductase beta subunit